MKFNKLAFIALLIVSGCCEDEIVESYRFNEFEKNLIPYTSFEELRFIDNEGNTFVNNSQPKDHVVDVDRAGPESCQLTEYEQETNFLYFQSQDILFKFELTTHYETNFTLTSTSESTENNGRFELACAGLFGSSIEERLTDLSIDQFDFQNVLVFQDCSESTEIERIVYSPVKGVEYLEFRDGRWLKLIE